MVAPDPARGVGGLEHDHLVGQLSNPVVPPLAGVEEFAGPSFRSAHCDNWYREAGTGRITTNWPGTVVEYQQRLAEVDWTAPEPVDHR